MSLLAFSELFRRLQDLDETIEIEAKTGREVGSATLRTVSAFSNEPGRGGGYILFGVAPREDLSATSSLTLARAFLQRGRGQGEGTSRQAKERSRRRGSLTPALSHAEKMRGRGGICELR